MHQKRIPDSGRNSLRKLLIPPVFVLLSLILLVAFNFFIQELNIIPFPFNLSGLVMVFTGFAIMGNARDLLKSTR